MTIKHLALFMPVDTPFYRRLFKNWADAFAQLDVRVSGGCGLMNSALLNDWLKQHRPDAVFEMNRVKDEIPILHDLKIPHISWIVDFGGRTQNQINGSDITYFFDPGWDDNYVVDGFQDWLPPGACTNSFFPKKSPRQVNIEFSFIGHIPKPWSREELDRPILTKTRTPSGLTFRDLVAAFNEKMDSITYRNQTHGSLLNIIEELALNMTGGVEIELPSVIRYDLLERVKRIKNRNELMGFALKKSKSISIFGTSNWLNWDDYKNYYNYFIDCATELNDVHQLSRFNLHDGLSFHFRSIECMASGGLVLWYNDNSGDRFNSVVSNHKKPGRGLHSFFTNMSNYIGFLWPEFDTVYDSIQDWSYFGSKYQQETLDIINDGHTWKHRAQKIMTDFSSL